MAFIVYDSSGIVRGVYATQGEADTAATGNAAWTAAQAAVTNDVEVGWTRATDGSLARTPVAPTEHALAGAALRTSHLTRLGRCYIRGMRDIEFWWPKVETSRTRAEAVLEQELPHWWRDAHSLVAAVVAGRAFDTMTEAQKETAVAHIEGLQGAGIIETWYRVGKAKTGNQGYFGTAGWIISGNNARVYTDAFEVSNGILVPRTPDYAWNQIEWPAAATTELEPADWNPEEPT